MFLILVKSKNRIDIHCRKSTQLRKFLSGWRERERTSDGLFLGKHRFIFLTSLVSIPRVHPSIIDGDLWFSCFYSRVSISTGSLYSLRWIIWECVLSFVRNSIHQEIIHRKKTKDLFQNNFVCFWRRRKKKKTVQRNQKERKKRTTHTDVYWIYTENTRNIIWKIGNSRE